MKIGLAYGRGRLTVDFPTEQTTVLEPTYVEGLPDERGAVRHALRFPIRAAPLNTSVSADQTVAVAVCDVTRPMSSQTVLPVVLDELSHVPNDNIVILIATGTHRRNTRNELIGMLGESTVGSVSCG